MSQAMAILLAAGAFLTCFSRAESHPRPRIGGRAQLLYAPEADETFRLRRLKLHIDGPVAPRATARLQLETGDGRIRVEESFLRLQPVEKLKVQLGIFKPALSRQFLTSSRDLLFPDRSLAVRTFAANSIDDDPTSLGYGAGRPPGMQFAADIGSHLYLAAHRDEHQELKIARLELHPWDDPGYAEGAIAGADSPRLVLDAGIAKDTGDFARDLLVLGGSVKWYRVSLQAERFRQFSDMPSPVSGTGHYWQTSWLIDPRHFEVAWRSSSIDLGLAMTGDRVREDAIGLNWYLDGHARKWQLELFRDRSLDGASDEQRGVKVQYQLTF